MKLWQHIKMVWQAVRSSFSFSPNVVYSALVDALYWFFTFFIAIIAKNQLVAEAYKLQSVTLSPAVLADQAAAQQALSVMKWFFVSGALVMVVVLVLEIVVYSACKGLIWLLLLNKKPSRQFFVGFFKLTLLWWLLWLVPGIILMFGLKPNYFAWIGGLGVLVFLHLTSLVHITFANTLSVKKALHSAFDVGILRVHFFIVPYVFAVGLYWLTVQLFNFLPQDQKFMLVAAIIYVIFYLAWFRTFILNYVKTMR